MKYDIAVTCASGIESVVRKELRALGFPNAKAIDGMFSLTGSALDVARINMFSASADRVYIKLFSSSVYSFDELFDVVVSYPFADILPFNARFTITGKSKASKLFSVSDCQSIVKKAMVKSLAAKYRRSFFPENGERYCFEFVLSHDVFSLYLNTSGNGLHKRGYRDLVGEAPLRETLACALLSLSDFSPDRPFCDPFCGSGTIVIEAARRALGIAPGKNRTFDFVKWDFFDSTAYSSALSEATDMETPDKKLLFFGSDIDKNAISLSLRHAKRAGVADKITFSTLDVGDFKTNLANGCIVTNPPYGERLLNNEEVGSLCSVMGNLFRTLNDWSFFALTAFSRFEKKFGKRADFDRKLYNGNLECHLYGYFPEKNN